jgi:hypothetical protein
MLAIDGSESHIEVRELAKYPSHGGSQGFKSPHLHPHNSPGYRPGGSLPLGRRRSRFPYRAANGQQPRTRTAKRYSIAARRRSEAKTYPTFRLRGGCSASDQTAPDGSSLLRLDTPAVQTDTEDRLNDQRMIKQARHLVRRLASRVGSLRSRRARVTGLGSGRATVPGELRDRRGRLVLLEPMDEVIGGHGPVDVVALDRVAAKRAQLPQGHRVLNPFGDHPEAKVAA